MPEHGRIPNPLDEEHALALLREGRAWGDVARELHVGYGRLRDFALANGMRPDARRGGRRAMPAADRRERKREEGRRRGERDREGRPSFTCAMCGDTFETPDVEGRGCHAQRRGVKMRRFVRLGGRTVCAACAAKRFRRRENRAGGVLAETFIARPSVRANIIPSFS